MYIKDHLERNELTPAVEMVLANIEIMRANKDLIMSFESADDKPLNLFELKRLWGGDNSSQFNPEYASCTALDLWSLDGEKMDNEEDVAWIIDYLDWECSCKVTPLEWLEVNYIFLKGNQKNSRYSLSYPLGYHKDFRNSKPENARKHHWHNPARWEYLDYLEVQLKTALETGSLIHYKKWV